jgi:hypothetical protein
MDVLSGLSWRNCTNATVCSRLDKLNQIRNCIAHGKEEITISGRTLALSLTIAQSYRDFAGSFGERFERHVQRKM